jgi:hypothetical protein
LRCGARTPRDCLNDHVWPYLREPKPTAGGDYKALAPCHEDTTHSLSVSAGVRAVVWCCHACKTRLGKDLMLARTRQALIDARVPERCLPMPADDARDLTEEIRGIVFGGGSRTHGWLRIAALLQGYDDLPRGTELEALAAECGVSRREAFAARAAGLQATTGTGPDDQ